MKRLWLALLLAAVPATAQEPKRPDNTALEQSKGDDGQPRVQKLFILKYADPNKLTGLLRVLGAEGVPHSELHALGVRARPESMPAIEDAIKRLDVPAAPPPNIEL